MLRALACAITFLTRIPLPAFSADARDFARGAGWFPAVGALIGALLWGCSRIEASLGARIASLLTVALWVAITGGLHLDGLADAADGFSGGHGDRDKTLAIMRDSRIGAHGAVALVLALLLKWALLEPLIAASPPHWLMAPVSARLACTALMAGFPRARSTGLGAAYAQMPRGPVLALGLATWLALVPWLGYASVIGTLAGVLAALALALHARRVLGGLTGDIYGAAIELSELGCLLALNLISPTLH